MSRKIETREASADAVQSAKDAGLRYVSDTASGIRRKQAARDFVMLDRMEQR
jgi:hypothetical protein